MLLFFQSSFKVVEHLLANLPNSQTVRMAICVLTICAHSLSRPRIIDSYSYLNFPIRLHGRGLHDILLP